MPVISLPLQLGTPYITTTFGAVYIGMMVGGMLYGLTIYQAYRYYTLYPNDRFGLKTYSHFIRAEFVHLDIVTARLLETTHSILWAIVGYHYLVVGVFDTLGIHHARWSIRSTILATGFTVVISQAFYAHRGVNGDLIGLLYGGEVGGVKAFTSVRLLSDFENIRWTTSVAYGLSVLSDALLAGALVFVLRRSRTGSRKADTVLDTLMKYTISTGLLTSLFSLLAFIFAIILPGNFIYAALSIVTAKLYANSVFAVVNSRQFIGQKLLADDFTIAHAQDNVDVEQPLEWRVYQPTTSSIAESIVA
ncbi:hypothetical protein C8Q77DRAFT_1162261 [Trametes polyzona]|nr:hypothetical protein C8Q77DRAFT_1162261 [Trametes polyzona]